MLTPPPPYVLRPLQQRDLNAIREIDRLSFPTPARPGLFEHELGENAMAHYQVLEQQEDDRSSPLVIGFAGFWLIADEVHISTIAVHPRWRGRGLGELLLLNLLFLAYTHPANMATLEVRRSNTAAQALYHKYRFEHVGERVRYYRDTGEDALIMTVAALNASYYQFLQTRQVALFARLKTEV